MFMTHIRFLWDIWNLQIPKDSIQWQQGKELANTLGSVMVELAASAVSSNP